MRKKLVSIMLTVCMLLTMLPTMAWAETAAVSCTHVHDVAVCGYVEAVTGVSCGNPEGTPCAHDNGCGYVAAVEAQPCTHVCDENCAPAQQQEQQEQQPAPVAEFDGTLDIADGSIVITATGYTQGDADGETAYTGDYVISQTGAATATANTITVNGGNPTITLSGVNMSVANPITIASGQKATLNLSGANTLTSSADNSSGIYASGAEVTINGTNADSLTITANGAEGVGINGSSNGKITINGGTFKITSNGNCIGRKQSSGDSTIVINGGVFSLTTQKGGRYCFHGNGGSFTMNGGTLKSMSAKNNYFVSATSKTFNGGNVNGFIPGPTMGGRTLTKLYFVNANGTPKANTDMAVAVGGSTWNAITDANGVITTYLADSDTVIAGTKYASGWLIGGTCTCAPTAFDWTGTSNAVSVYSTDVTIPVKVTVNKCNMPIHEVGNVTWEILGGGANATKNSDGTLTLKSSASNYDVTLKASLDSLTLSESTYIISVTANDSIKSIDISKGIVVAEAGTDGKTKYTQYSGTSTTELSSFEVEATEEVYIFGTYSAAATPIINIKGGTPNIVLKNMSITNTNNTYALSVAAGVEANISLEGNNTITGTARNSIQVASGAKLTIDSAVDNTNGTGLTSVVNAFKNDHNVDITQTKYAGTLNTGTFTGNGKVYIKGGNINSDVGGYAFQNIGNLEITGGNIYAAASRLVSVWANNLTITGGSLYACDTNTTSTTSYRAVLSGNTITLGTEGDDTNSKQLYIYANTGKNNGAAIGGHYDCTVNIHSGVIIADASGNGNAVAIGIGNTSNKDDTPVVNINITGGDITAIGPEPVRVDNGDGTSYISAALAIGSRGNSQSNSGGVNGQGTISITGGTISTNGVVGLGMCLQDQEAVRNGEMTVEQAKALFAYSSMTIGGDATVVKTSDLDYTPIGTGYYGTTISGDASFMDVELPEGVDSLTFLANTPWALKANTDGSVTVPAGTVVEKADGTTVTLPNGGTMDADGNITTDGSEITENADGSVTVEDAEGNKTTITPPVDGGDVVVNTDGTMTLPEGTVVKNPDGTTTTYPDGGTMDAEGNITTDGSEITENADGSVTVEDAEGNKTTITPPAGEDVTVKPDGEVEVPAGSTVTTPDNNVTTLPDGGSVGADGTVATEGTKITEDPATGKVTITDKDGNTTTITPPADGKVTVDSEGNVTIPAGSTVDGVTMPEDIGTVTIPADKANEVEIADNGTTTLPAGSTVTKEDGSSVELSDGGDVAADGGITAGGTVVTKDKDGKTVSTVVVPDGKTATVGSDGKITAPAGTTVTDKDGKENTLTIGGTVTADGTVKHNSYGYYIPTTTPSDKPADNPADKPADKPATTTPVTPPAEEVVTPAPEDKPAVDEPVVDEPVVDDPAVDVPADDTEQGGGAGLWIGIGIVALAGAVGVLGSMAVRKKKRD